MSEEETRTGAEVMADVLAAAGVTVVGGIPGHTIGDFALAVGAHDSLSELLVRHEATAAFAADVYHRVGGGLMALFTHAFPGAANALTGVANAYADYSSLVWIAGNTASAGIGRGGYQELSRQIDDDLTELMRPAVKRLWRPRTADDIAHNLLAALRESRSGRPGPVALNVSQEMWTQIATGARGRIDIDRYVFADDRPRPDTVHVAAAADLLAGARRPVILAGNGVNLARARGELRSFARRRGIPVATTASGKGAFPETDDLSVGVAGWVGTGTANFATTHADVLLVLGARLSEPTSSSWVEGTTFSDATRIIQVDADASGLANAYPVEVPVIGHLASVLSDLDAALDDRSLSSLDAWYADIAEARREWKETELVSQTPGSIGQIGTGAVVVALRRAFPAAINLVNDCGKHHKWVAQQFVAGDDDYVVSSMGGASMGIGLAGAIGAHLARPEARTVAWLGDGGMAMSLSALPTIAEYRLPITTVVIDDASYGVVHNTQMAQVGRTAFADFDGSGTNPDYRLDFTAVAEGCGMPARTVSDPAMLDDAFDWAAAQTGPCLLTVLSDRGSQHPDGGGVLRPLNDRSRSLVWRQD